MDLGLKGKRVLVTGGTKSIGRAIVDAFVAEGAVVGFCARDAKLVKEREAEWQGKQARVHGTALDVTDDPALKKWIDGFAADGGIDHFVANVTARRHRGYAGGLAQGIEIDLVSTVNAVRHVRPHLEKRGAGATLTIIGTVSLVEVSGPTQPYRSVKAALVPLVKSLSPSTWRPRACAPTWCRPAPSSRTATPGAASATPAPSATSACWRATRRAAWARRRKWRPRRLPRRHAGSFVSGANFIVDGAITARVQY